VFKLKKLKKYLSQHKNISLQEYLDTFKNEFDGGEIGYIYIEDKLLRKIFNFLLRLIVIYAILIFLIYIFRNSYTKELMHIVDSSVTLTVMAMSLFVVIPGLIICCPFFLDLAMDRFFQFVYGLSKGEIIESKPSSQFTYYVYGNIKKTFSKKVNDIDYQIAIFNAHKSTGYNSRLLFFPEIHTRCYLFLTTDIKKDLPDMTFRKKSLELTNWKGKLDLETENQEFYKNYKVFTDTATVEQMDKIINKKLIEYSLQPEVLNKLKSFTIENGRITSIYRLPLFDYSDFLKDLLKLRFAVRGPANYSKIYKNYNNIFEINKNILNLLNK
jgi:hypothetical protein